MMRPITVARCLGLGLLLAGCSEGAKPPAVARVTVEGVSGPLEPGQTLTLTATLADASGQPLTGRAITWTSSASAIASVSSGGSSSATVTGVSEGSVTISATSEGVNGSVPLTVRFAVRRVDVSPASATLLVGGAPATLTALLSDSRGQPITGRPVTWTSTNPAVVTVSTTGVVSAVAPGGPVQVTASAEGISGSASVTVIAPVASVTVSPATASVIPGQTTTLQATLRDAGGATLTGRAVTWSSSDPTIASVSNAGVVTGLVPGGPITITATSEGRTGTAQVTVTGGCAVTRPASLDQTVSGRISATDCRLQDGSYAQKWEVVLTAPTLVDWTMTSSEFDSYLLVVDQATNTVVAEDDDGAGGTNSRVFRQLPAGRYVVYANTYSPNVFGNYALALRRASAGCTPAASALPLGVTASLSTSSCRLNDNSYVQLYSVTVPSRSIYTVDMTSTQLDPYVLVLDANWQFIGGDDNSGGGSSARLELTLEPGVYIVAANAQPQQTGAFRLDMRDKTNPCSVRGTLTLGQTLTGALAATDCTVNSTGAVPFTQRWGIALAAATTVQVDMASSAFDTYLLLENAQGTIIAEDDDGGGGTNSRLLVNLPAGQYVVQASSLSFNQVGAFTLTARAFTSATPVSVSVTPATLSLATGSTATLSATVTGSSNTGVTWRSSNENVVQVSSTGGVRALAAGTATITATAVADPSKSASSSVTVSTANLPNLTIGDMYVVQAVQDPAWSVPIVAGRNAMARIWVRGDRSGLASVAVRLRLYLNGTLVGTYSANTTPVTTVSEACCSADLPLPASLLQSGAAVLADVDPSSTVAESNETDNTYPLNGTPRALTMTTVPDLDLRYIPIRQRRSGLTGNPTTTLSNSLRAMFPVGVINLTVATTMETDVTLLGGSAANNGWSDLLRELEVKRVAEGRRDYYLGAVRVTYNSGVIGLAYTPGRSGLTIDEGSTFGPTVSRNTVAHEIGHNFNRRHAPCGGPANVDPNFPSPTARTGIFGWNLFEGTGLQQPTQPDVMSYCDETPQWVSAYTYNGVRAYRAANPLLAGATTPRPALVVSGAIRGGAVSLDPVLHLDAVPAGVAAQGRYRFEAFDANGGSVVRGFFDAREFDDLPGTSGFVVAVPLDPAQRARVVRVEVTDGQSGARAQRLSGGAALMARPTDIADAMQVTRAGTASQLRWDRRAYPLVVVRHPETNEVIAFAREGEFDVGARGLSSVRLEVSDGVRSVPMVFDGRTGKVRQ